MRTEWAFLAGLGVGAVAGLILAPQSGKDTQEILAGKLKGGLDQVASAGKKVGAQVKDFANRKKKTPPKPSTRQRGLPNVWNRGLTDQQRLV